LLNANRSHRLIQAEVEGPVARSTCR
jgi:hypothetical protein